jgi:hypothetical protein
MQSLQGFGEGLMGCPVRVGALAVLIALASSPSRGQTSEDWIKLGERVHGAFGAFIPVGIRIGQDALHRLKAQPREVSVTYYDSDKGAVRVYRRRNHDCDNSEPWSEDAHRSNGKGACWRDGSCHHPT